VKLSSLAIHHQAYFAGTIPLDIVRLSSLVEINLEANYLSGSIPSDLAMLPHLKTLILNNNRLSGTIPTLPFKNYTGGCDLTSNVWACPIKAAVLQACSPGLSCSASSQTSPNEWNAPTLVLICVSSILSIIIAITLVYIAFKRRQQRRKVVGALSKPLMPDFSQQSWYKFHTSHPAVLAQSLIIPLNQLKLKLVVGAGSQGSVWKANYLGSTVAVKEIFQSPFLAQEGRASYLRELQILSSLHHPSVLRLLGTSTSDTSFFLVTEFCEYDLKRLLESDLSGSNQPEEWLSINTQIASAFVYVHDRGIIHRDLKPANGNWSLGPQTCTDHDDNIFSSPLLKLTISSSLVLLSPFPSPSKCKWRVQVADFGLSFMQLRPKACAFISKATFDQHSLTQGVGTPEFMAPEVLQASQNNQIGTSISAKGQAVYGRKVDVFAFGMLLYYSWTGQRPFNHLLEKTHQTTYSTWFCLEAVMQGARPPLPLPSKQNYAASHIPPMNPIVVALIASCWAHKPSQRPEFQSIFKQLGTIAETARMAGNDFWKGFPNRNYVAGL